jgi:hypothetical protein
VVSIDGGVDNAQFIDKVVWSNCDVLRNQWHCDLTKVCSLVPEGSICPHVKNSESARMHQVVWFVCRGGVLVPFVFVRLLPENSVLFYCNCHSSVVRRKEVYYHKMAQPHLCCNVKLCNVMQCNALA